MADNQQLADELMDLINACKGHVAFVTAEGDRLVANSVLSALVGISTLLSMASRVDLRLECDDPEDCDRIESFMRRHHIGHYADK